MHPSMITPEFRTERLNVFRINIKSSETTKVRSVFLGFSRDEEIPWPVVSATVWIDGPYLGHTLEMINTHDNHRQVGFARDLWLGIEEHLGGAVSAIPESPEGAALARSVANAREALGRPATDLNDPSVQTSIRQNYLGINTR